MNNSKFIYSVLNSSNLEEPMVNKDGPFKIKEYIVKLGQGWTRCYNYEQNIHNKPILYTYCDSADPRIISPLTFAFWLLAFIIWHQR